MNDYNESWNADDLLVLVEQQQDELEQKEQQILELSSIKQELESTVQMQSRKIANQSEHIEMLYESDQLLQNAQELKKRSEEQWMLAENAQRTAEATTRNYENKRKEAERLCKDQNDLIDRRANAKIQSYKWELQNRSDALAKRYNDKYHELTNRYYSIMITLIIYSVVTTIMKIGTSSACIHHFEMFFMNIYNMLLFFEDGFIEVINTTTGFQSFGGFIVDGACVLLGLVFLMALFVIICMAIPTAAGYFYYSTILKAEKTLFHDIGIAIAAGSFVVLLWICDLIPESFGLSIVWMWMITQLLVALGMEYYNFKHE